MDLNYVEAENRFITTKTGTRYAYREMGDKTSFPIILLNHLSANLDNWDPRLMNKLALNHHLITFDYAGVGLSGGKVNTSIEGMAGDTIEFIQSLGYQKVDILALSMGGMIAQELIEQASGLVRKLVLAGTGPRGGIGIADVTRITYYDILRAALSGKNVKTYLFFTRTDHGKQEAAYFLKQLKLRKKDRDKAISLPAFQKQLKAINKWGMAKPKTLSFITQPTLVVNGDHDRMVPTENSYVLAKKITNAELVLYEDAGHVAIFQEYQNFANKFTAFIELN